MEIVSFAQIDGEYFFYASAWHQVNVTWGRIEPVAERGAEVVALRAKSTVALRKPSLSPASWRLPSKVKPKTFSY